MSRRRKGTGSITHQGGDRYLLRWRDQTGRQRSKRFRGTYAQAERELRRLEYEAESQQSICQDKAGLTLKEFSEAWLKDAKISCKPRTYESYEETLRVHILPSFGHYKLSEITRKMVHDFLISKLKEKSKHGRPRSVTSVKYMQTVLKMVFNAAIELGYTEFNPANLRRTIKFDKIKEMRQEGKKKAVIMTKQQMHELLELTRKDYFYPAYLIALETGLRRGEILGLKWSDIDFKTGTLSIRKAVQRIKGEGIKVGPTKSLTSERDVVIGPKLIEILKQHRKEQLKTKMLMARVYQDENWVFCRPDGRLWDPKTFYEHFKKLVEKAGLPATTTLHHLRHNYTTYCIDAGHQRKEVSENLGHADEEITKRYDHETYERKKKAALEMESLIFPSEPQLQSQQEPQQ